MKMSELLDVISGDTILTVHDRRREYLFVDGRMSEREKGIVIFQQPARCLTAIAYGSHEVLWIHTEGEKRLYVEIDYEDGCNFVWDGNDEPLLRHYTRLVTRMLNASEEHRDANERTVRIALINLIQMGTPLEQIYAAWTDALAQQNLNS